MQEARESRLFKFGSMWSQPWKLVMFYTMTYGSLGLSEVLVVFFCGDGESPR